MNASRAYGLATFGLLAAGILATWAVYTQLPETIPVHWDIENKVNRYGPKKTVFTLPVVMTVLALILWGLPYLSPKSFAAEGLRPLYSFVTFLAVAFLVYILGVVLWTTLATVRPSYIQIDSGRWILAGVFLLLALLGSTLDKAPRNPYIGVRTPWTFASERIWSDTHRLARRTLIACGILGFLVALVGYPFSRLAAVAASVTLILIAALVPVIYSYILYRRLKALGEL
jgi:uncharacterized membrane protein